MGLLRLPGVRASFPSLHQVAKGCAGQLWVGLLQVEKATDPCVPHPVKEVSDEQDEVQGKGRICKSFGWVMVTHRNSIYFPWHQQSSFTKHSVHYIKFEAIVENT